MLPPFISRSVLKKLRQKHRVTKDEVSECFENYDSNHRLLKDIRPEHKTEPDTLWFIGETNNGRNLKICFIKDGSYSLKTAYDPNPDELDLFFSSQINTD